MTDIKELIDTLRSAYKRLSDVDPGWAGKSSEAVVEVSYPGLWDRDADPYTPSMITVWSYALGPSRSHYFLVGGKDKHPNYYTWESPDPVATAIRVVNEWINEVEGSVANEDDSPPTKKNPPRT